MGILAIILAAIAGFAVGAVWYMQLSKPWLAAAEIECDENGKPVGGFSITPFIIGFICMLCVSGMLRHTLEASDIEGVLASAVTGFGVGLFFITPWVAMNYAYSKRKPLLTVLDGGYSVIGPTVMGFVLGLF
ncbi:DUF1761 domain-containing protein [Pelagovum pacificum]|uniref:DUF1761 domain-containing protein n=1 Tax=Pelagovum pacificum TaxID=2588711 RepID=A0A5C5GH64_9RHOB|nr:DUF1761 domain-containing protein [Pelagovum pacificum]QQA42744.1 DUF1761 domain-containing protein [Pelagovum pacificum]TNY34105.1 DUF1761 domain-containing protein [Pelagovum pacificum]